MARIPGSVWFLLSLGACVGAQEGNDSLQGQDCAESCVEGATQCAPGGLLQACRKDDMGCPYWATMEGAGCRGPCTPGQKRCDADGTAVELCDSAGVWLKAEGCERACVDGACTLDVQCTPGASRCQGNSVEICNGSGTAWLWASECPVVCRAGLCEGACTPGERRCHANQVEECREDGSAWAARETCAEACDAQTARCVLSQLEVNAPNTVLEGTIVVRGALVVRSGASVLSHTGDLTLQADSITVEPQASILVMARGETPEGAGLHAARSVSSGTCSSGGSGGGYGERGGAGTLAGGAIHGVATNAEVSPGSTGGRGQNSLCTEYAEGGKGGGRVRLRARSVVLDGLVVANGADGASDVGAGGGGSGGGVLVAGDTVRQGATGVVTVLGGAGGTSSGGGSSGGRGGKGRIKVLSGITPVLEGAMEGVLTKGLLPPLEVSSSTHPRADRVYNDGFPSVKLSWNRAFQNVQGYYYAVNSTPNRPPTPAVGKFTPGESLSLDPSALVQGTNYFHLASVDAASSVGGIETAFKIQLNTQAPQVTSQSHPASSVWNTNRDVFFSWTFAQADEHLRGVYYVLDQFGDTQPTKTDTFLPVTQKQLLRSGMADGIYVFHLVSEDTMGYLNKSARHLTVRVGPNPGTGQILVMVKNAAGQNVSGARVTINRGLFPAPDTSNGTSNVTNVPVGTWEVTVSKTGFQKAVQWVSVQKDIPATLNLQLVP